MDVCLKKWRIEDADLFAGLIRAMDRTYTSNRLPDPYTLHDSISYLSNVLEKDGRSGIYRAIVSDGEYVGNISVVQNTDVGLIDSEISYFVLNDYRSKGITTEAVKQICPIAFDELDIQRITAYAFAPNAASVKVLERSGFILEGRMKNALIKHGRVQDQLIYGKYR